MEEARKTHGCWPTRGAPKVAEPQGHKDAKPAKGEDGGEKEPGSDTGPAKHKIVVTANFQSYDLDARTVLIGGGTNNSDVKKGDVWSLGHIQGFVSEPYEYRSKIKLAGVTREEFEKAITSYGRKLTPGPPKVSAPQNGQEASASGQASAGQVKAAKGKGPGEAGLEGTKAIRTKVVFQKVERNYQGGWGMQFKFGVEGNLRAESFAYSGPPGNVRAMTAAILQRLQELSDERELYGFDSSELEMHASYLAAELKKAPQMHAMQRRIAERAKTNH